MKKPYVTPCTHTAPTQEAPRKYAVKELFQQNFCTSQPAYIEPTMEQDAR